MYPYLVTASFLKNLYFTCLFNLIYVTIIDYKHTTGANITLMFYFTDRFVLNILT